MKTRDWFAMYILLVSAPIAGISQCSNTIRTVTYDTTVTGTGVTNNPYNFSFTGFDGTIGTLLNVHIASVITLAYDYTIENSDLVNRPTLRMRVLREDELWGSTLSEPISASYLSPYQYHNLSASDGVPGSGPDFNSRLVYVRNQDTIMNLHTGAVTDYISEAPVEFSYSTNIESSVSNGNASVQSQTSDIIKFSVTYTYCDNIMLAANVHSFTVNKKDDVVDVRWSTSSESKDKIYELQKSYDGQHFTPVEQFASVPNYNQSGSYQYNYIPVVSDKGKVTFRIKQTEKDGTVKYSSLRVVDLGDIIIKPGFRLLPNPSRGGQVNIVFNNASRSDWQVDIFTSSGQLIESKQFQNSLTGKFNDARLPRGLYLVKATNKKTQETFIERLISE